eukprot:CAMPEP_0119147362 /NCGR_PEP_ID=MMETSP1310-20130426/40242_1 /TAXON_ID=464262 /ORGANISM="Genus nov. species nov., Strain RCC2339" /LENGTH=154 /DNA_ID=CAMNT_0007139329 /DNA_START=95 /DNA_END=559 /DNA_ORIENTATION=+
MASRLLKELRQMEKEPCNEIILKPKNDSDLFVWAGWIRGPPDTPFENGLFELDIQIPSRYPLQPPVIRFVTRVFHPNIHWETGEICLDLLKNAWSAVYTLENVCRSIMTLLAHPEPDSPLNCDAGNLLRSGDERGYTSLARMYTVLYTSFKKPG